jgi:hypothetical protein
MLFPMDFRAKNCAWCKLREEPLAMCKPCPKYSRYDLRQDHQLDMNSFCSICIHRDSEELSVFCRTNRYLQEDSGEDFECYRFCLNVG